jgi:hypothetical protein
LAGSMPQKSGMRLRTSTSSSKLLIVAASP